MLMTKTTELGLQSVLYMAQQPEQHRVNPQEIAERLGESAPYIAKVLRDLARAGIIRSHRGVAGGFELARPTHAISLLDVVEACQGPVQGNYCQEVPPERVPLMCGWHMAMWELRENCRSILSKWTLDRILARPVAQVPSPGCRYRRVRIKFERVEA